MAKAVAENAWFQFVDDSMSRILPYGTKFLLHTKLLGIDESGVRVQNIKTKHEHRLKVDYVVLAMGVRPNRELKEQLEQKGIRCALIGDAASGGTIGNATQSAFRAAMKL